MELPRAPSTGGARGDIIWERRKDRRRQGAVPNTWVQGSETLPVLPFPQPQLIKTSTEVFRQDRKHQTTRTCHSSTWQVGRALCLLWRWNSLLAAPLLVWELPQPGVLATWSCFTDSKELRHATKQEKPSSGTSRGRWVCFL